MHYLTAAGDKFGHAKKPHKKPPTKKSTQLPPMKIQTQYTRSEQPCTWTVFILELRAKLFFFSKYAKEKKETSQWETF